MHIFVVNDFNVYAQIKKNGDGSIVSRAYVYIETHKKEDGTVVNPNSALIIVSSLLQSLFKSDDPNPLSY